MKLLNTNIEARLSLGFSVKDYFIMGLPSEYLKEYQYKGLFIDLQAVSNLGRLR